MWIFFFLVKGIDDNDDDVNEEEVLTEAYKKTFDLVDTDGSGTLDKSELVQWLTMCGAELDLKSILGTVLY